jgi:CheY-like chemotaxis protein
MDEPGAGPSAPPDRCNFVAIERSSGPLGGSRCRSAQRVTCRCDVGLCNSLAARAEPVSSASQTPAPPRPIRSKVDERTAPPKIKQIMQPQGGIAAASNGNIMVVEDNDKLASLLRRALERAGYQVALAISGADMRMQLALARPDLIVMDITLPDADGRDLLSALKKDPSFSSIPVVVWSGRYTDSDSRVALELGAEDYVEKGSAVALVHKIERVLLRLSETQLIAARGSDE